jgi:hypothetical protein
MNKCYTYIMKNKRILLSLLSLIIVPFSSVVRADTIPTQQVAPSIMPPTLIKIMDAKATLTTINLNYQLSPIYRTVVKKVKKKKTYQQILTGYQLGSKDIAVAVLDPNTNQIHVVVGQQSGRQMSFNDPVVNLQLVRFNGVNSRFQVNSPAGGKVLAVKYLITSQESGSKSVIEQNLRPVVYVPFSPNLESPDLELVGANYLSNLISSVAQDLQNIPSQSIPGKSITEAIPPAMIKALIYAEHTSYAPANAAEAQASFSQLNVLFAGNQEDTYKYSVSNDGYSSVGISQFIPSTYQSLVQRHPNNGLIADYRSGMENHRNAIKAMYLLLDDYAGAVRVKAHEGFASGRVFDYAAASYNGGTTRVANAVENFGDKWNEDRNGQANALRGQLGSLSNQTNSLKKQIRASKNKKVKAALQSELGSAQAKISNVNDQIDQIDSATLRSGTINYLNKIYGVIQYFNDQNH